MTVIPYTYEIVAVGPMSMEVVYTNPTYGSMQVGCRLPFDGETVEQIIAQSAPAAWWRDQSRAKVVPTIGTTGAAEAVLETLPEELTAAELLDLWRNRAVISKLQAHQTLDDWGLFQQVESMVAEIGNPVERAFYDAIEWRRNSPTIQAMFSSIVMPSGNAPTPEEVDQFFNEAAGYTV